MTNAEAFVQAFTALFPGQVVPPVPTTPEDLSLTHAVAIRSSHPMVWQRLFSGQGEPLPADVQLRLAKGELYPEDASALRAGHWDGHAAQCDQQRQAIIDRAHAATRAREQAQYEAEAARSKQFREASLLERLAMSPLSDSAIQQARQQWGVSGD